MKRLTRNRRTVHARQEHKAGRNLARLGLPIGAVKLLSASSVMVAGISGAQTGLGATALTRMSRPTYWFDRPRVKEMMAPLVEV